MRKYKRCYCGTPYLPDGTCKHGCDPTLRAPGARRLSVESRAKERERAAVSTTTLLGAREAREGVAKALPLRVRYAGCEDFVRRVNG